jgi:predicted P-loop ATPase
MSLNDDNDDKIVSLVSRAGRKSTRKAKVLASIDFGDITAAGAIKATCANTRIAIGKLEISCGYDVFHDKLLIGGQPIGQHAGELSDHACLVLRKLVDDKFGFDPGRNHVFDACVQLALENSFDPVVDYLDGLEWDGTPRIDEWLTTYLGAADTKLNSVIGRIALIAQVRRARSPGCKFDQIIVLESAEGELKSSALSVLAGGPENFSDQTILGRGDKEQQELLRGVWVYEIADLSNIRKAEVEDVKAFASRTYDRARPAYGRCEGI